MILLLKLFLAHILGDFVFQPSAWITDKETRKIKSRCLYQHGIIHFVLIIFIVQDVHFWKYALLLSLIHLAIYILKVYKQPAALPNVPDKDRQKWFFYDQILHLVTLFLVWYSTRIRQWSLLSGTMYLSSFVLQDLFLSQSQLQF